MIRKNLIRKLLKEQTDILVKMQDIYVKICSKEQAISIEGLELRIEIAKQVGMVTMLLKLLDYGTEQKS